MIISPNKDNHKGFNYGRRWSAIIQIYEMGQHGHHKILGIKAHNMPTWKVQ